MLNAPEVLFKFNISYFIKNTGLVSKTCALAKKQENKEKGFIRKMVQVMELDLNFSTEFFY